MKATLRLSSAGAALAVAGAMLFAVPAAAEPAGPEEFGQPTSDQVAASIQVWDPNGHVEPIESTRTDADETVVSLDSDILFAFGSAELSPVAVARLADLVADVPQGIAVSVIGHTDDVGSDADNLVLSQQRAETVAGAVAAARPDLILDIEGRGESDPVESNSDPEGREQNRRVEIRYTG